MDTQLTDTQPTDTQPTDTDTGPRTDAADLAAIGQVVATVQRTQRAKDAEGFLALFHPDALWTTGHGKVLVGLDAIAEFTRAVLPQADWDGEVTYDVVHAQFLRPDVAAVKVRQVYHAPDGDPGGDTEGAPLYVMSRQSDGRWLLHACQNTPVLQG
ncbi:SgcJ/EcaC family oxidoreductase [Streptomyces sp. LHD-70]|uniref:SgcJ/EcaC family oxidoreductase n=1 Tax=Streptomyces sp. LHD-70 TaxID=3072140 RepID=UPI00280C4147|nr:SgcJ/EcaC family oxidoreductase [Streptomyces sp. LHD-70]MDQ8702022.1 SgcJ/EcaC family oxidoreductase [Streptomyces sp. LHD-70]